MAKNIMKVTQIPKLQRKKRVAAYARVSSGKDAMLHSLSAQVSYYNDLIQRADSWEFVGVYSDEAVTGTKEERLGFQQKKYSRLEKRYEKAVEKLKAATAERDHRMQRDRDLRIFIGSIIERPLILESWNEGLWIDLLDCATVYADGRIVFRFKDSTEIEVVAV